MKKTIANSKPFTFNGYIEGFYGRPHRLEEQIHLISFMAKQGLDTYVYAPKDNDKHRRLWRRPYTKKECDTFRTLIKHCQRSGVAFVFALSPGLSYKFDDPSDFKLLKSKFRQIERLGGTHFALLMDDIPEQAPRPFPSTGDAHVWLANQILAAFPAATWFFCPMEYCDTMAQPDVKTSAYLQTLAALAPQFSVFWTGRHIVSRKITSRDLQTICRILQRKVIIWDNFHANDYATNRVFLGPLTGRSKTLANHISGYLTNMTDMPYLNKIALSTVAAYCKDPDNYRPSQSQRDALNDLAPKAVDHLQWLIDFYLSPWEMGPHARQLCSKIEQKTLSLAQLDKRIAWLDTLTNVVDDRSLFGELYRYKHMVAGNLRLLRHVVKAVKLSTLPRTHARQRNGLDRYVDQLFYSSQ